MAAGETVFDVPAVLASRVRVLGTGRSQKNDPMTPARSRSRRCAQTGWPRSAPMTTPGSCDCWPNDIGDMARLRNQHCTRLHALLLELSVGGMAQKSP